MERTVPENCRDCTCDRTCGAWHYGEDKCPYKDEIRKHKEE